MTHRLKLIIFIKDVRSWPGGQEYYEALIYALGLLSSQNQPFELCVFSDDELSPHIQEFVTRVYTTKDLHPVTFSDRIKWKLNSILSTDKNPHIDSFLRKEKIDFIYPYFSSDKRPKAYRSAAWIPDFQHKYLAGYFTKTEVNFRDKSFFRTASHAEKIILSSKVAESDCHSFYPESEGKTHVMSFRTVPHENWYEENPLETQRKYNLPENFLLVSNQFWQHKNHLLIFKALQLLKNQGIFPTVVCTGKMYDHRHPEYLDKVLSTVNESGISQQVKFLGHIPKIDQIQLIRRSIAVIQPSLFEGWSTIVENARCFGKPMILSDLPVHLEQDISDSLVFERSSATHLADCISDYWEGLSPGPDLEKENLALHRQKKLVNNFGRKFLEIIQQ